MSNENDSTADHSGHRAPRASEVEIGRRGEVSVLRFARAERHNSIGGRLFAEILTAAEDADADEAIGALVTTGAGPTYCVGADLAELEQLADAGTVDLGAIGVDGIGGHKGLPHQSAAQKQSDHLGIGRWALRFRELGIPTVAAINGAAAGGGLGLALLHDVRIASATARFTAGFVSVGLGPELGMSGLLVRILGEARAFSLLTRTEPVDAHEALALGLVEAVVGPDELVEAAVDRASALAALPSAAVRATKRLVHAASASALTDQLEREWMAQRALFASDETRRLLAESLKALQRRRP